MMCLLTNVQSCWHCSVRVLYATLSCNTAPAQPCASAVASVLVVAVVGTWNPLVGVDKAEVGMAVVDMAEERKTA
eukprot:3905664-Amphidinium_carterae.1